MKLRSLLTSNRIMLVFLSLLGMFLAVGLLGETYIDVDAFELMISLTPFQDGITSLSLPPVGEISAQTHWLPFQVNVSLQNVNLDMLQDNVQNIENMEGWQSELMREAGWGMAWFLVRNILVSFLGGALVVFLLVPPSIPRRFWKGGALGAIFFVLIVLLTVVLPYDTAAFESPQYHGVLSAAPWAMSFFDQGLAAVQTITQQLQTMTDNLFYLFEGLEQLRPREETSALKVLHVSDVHNNPAALGFIQEVVNVFDIDLVVDTGDITDYGTPLEADLVSGVANLPVPYVFIPGNHDSPMVIDHLREKGVIVLEDSVEEINGLVIAGVSDPAAVSHDKIRPTHAELVEHAEYVEPMLEENQEDIEVLAVHNPELGEMLSDYSPVVLTGHTHIALAEEQPETITINAGTTGASGLRGLERPEDPYSMFILYYKEHGEREYGEGEEGYYLSYADLISVPQLPGGFNLERIYFQ